MTQSNLFEKGLLSGDGTTPIPGRIQGAVLAPFLWIASCLPRNSALDPISGTRANSLSAVTLPGGKARSPLLRFTRRFPSDARCISVVEIASILIDLDIPAPCDRQMKPRHVKKKKNATSVNVRND